MTTAAEMYDGVLHELDQYGSPVFDFKDFNYFVNKAVERRLKPELDSFELTQKVTDKLRPLIKRSNALSFNPTNSTDVRSNVLPTDYRHIVSCLVRLRYKTASVVFSENAVRSDYTKRATGDSEAYMFSNSYLRPLVSDADVRMYHRVRGNEVEILIDTVAYPETKALIESVILEFISKPAKIALNLEDGSVVTDTVFPENFNQEIVEECAKLFLENNESARLASYDAVNN